MTLQETAQIVGGIGVIASLIYVAIQIRNNTRAQRAATYQQLSVMSMQGWTALALNGEATSIVLRGMDDFSALSRVEKARFRFSLMTYAKGFENAWFQRNIGTLRESDWKAITGDMDSLFSAPGSHAAWPLVKSRFNAEFVAFVDDVLKRQLAVAAAYVPPPLPVIPVKAKRPKK